MRKKERKPGFRGTFNKLNNRGQVSVFIILALVIVLILVLFFVFRGRLFEESVPKEFKPVYDFYLGCIDEQTRYGTLILGEQGGYIDVPEFKPGSVYMPFSSQLDFLGSPVPYWSYVSGNGVLQEQIPSKEKMESQLSDFLEERMTGCDFSEFAKEGYRIELGREVKTKTKINANNIDVQVKQDLNIIFGEDSWRSSVHDKKINSNTGSFYDLSVKIYEDYKDSMFLEKFGVDILRLYAPVDGSEIGCSPIIWNVGEVRENLTRALEANIGFIKLKGNYYNLKKKDNVYFVHDIGEEVSPNINFLYLREWPMKMEVWPSEGGLMKADPVGNQEGLGMLGFCYVPYHFVYDFAYPVMIQIYNQGEMFQFPLVIYINKNNPREPLDIEGMPDVVPELCEHKNSEISVSTFDKDLNPVEADISFKCFDTTCDIGRTRLQSGQAVFKGMFPQCVNGYILAKAPGFEIGRYIVSSIDENDFSILLDKKYRLNLEVTMDGSPLGRGDSSVVSFIKNEESLTLSYPDQKEVELSEGQYEIKVYVYSDSNIYLKGTTSQKCVKVPKSGILGVFGMNEEKCFDMDIPGQNIDLAVSGGGKQNYYILENELKSSKIVINSQGFDVPSKVEDLQENYNRVEVSGLNVRFE